MRDGAPVPSDVTGAGDGLVADAPRSGRRRARSRALHALGRRDHSVAELRSKLLARGHVAGDVDDVITELERAGFLGDTGVAERFVRDRRESGWGDRRIEARLIERGVDARIVAAALAGAGAGGGGEIEDELDRARAVLRRRLRSGGPADDGARRRAYGLLARRGFGPDVAERAVAEALGRAD